MQVTYKNGRKYYSLYESAKVEDVPFADVQEYPEEENAVSYFSDGKSASIAGPDASKGDISVMSTPLSDKPYK